MTCCKLKNPVFPREGHFSLVLLIKLTPRVRTGEMMTQWTVLVFDRVIQSSCLKGNSKQPADNNVRGQTIILVSNKPPHNPNLLIRLSPKLFIVNILQTVYSVQTDLLVSTHTVFQCNEFQVCSPDGFIRQFTVERWHGMKAGRCHEGQVVRWFMFAVLTPPKATRGPALKLKL